MTSLTVIIVLIQYVVSLMECMFLRPRVGRECREENTRGRSSLHVQHKIKNQ